MNTIQKTLTAATVTTSMMMVTPLTVFATTNPEDEPTPTPQPTPTIPIDTTEGVIVNQIPNTVIWVVLTFLGIIALMVSVLTVSVIISNRRHNQIHRTIRKIQRQQNRQRLQNKRMNRNRPPLGLDFDQPDPTSLSYRIGIPEEPENAAPGEPTVFPRQNPNQ